MRELTDALLPSLVTSFSLYAEENWGIMPGRTAHVPEERYKPGCEASDRPGKEARDRPGNEALDTTGNEARGRMAMEPEIGRPSRPEAIEE